jgi:hypothetical protein
MGGDRLYPVAGRRAVMNTICVVWGAPVSFVGDAYVEGRVVGRRRESRIMGYGMYPGDNGAGASSNGVGRRCRWWGERWSCLEAASGNVESRLGRSVVYI